MNFNPQNSQEYRIQKKNVFSRLFGATAVKQNPAPTIADAAAGTSDIINCIKNARSQWLTANANFEYANEQELVDYYTYEIKACQVRYEYYIKKAKEMGLKVDTLDIPIVS